jgi:hypothetical protein
VSAPTGNGSNNRSGSAIGTSLIVLVSLALFIAAFIAFMMAPLVMVAVVAGGMWSLERWGKRNKRAVGVTPIPSVPRAPGSTVEADEPVTSYGFGARVGENL